MNPTPPPAAPYQAPAAQLDTGSDTLRLIAGLVLVLGAAGAVVGALLYRARPQPPRHWYTTLRDDLAQQLKQLERVAAAIRSEVERG